VISSRIVVVGIGNLIRTDDGFGVHALRRLQLDPRTPQDVAFVDGGTLGPELVSYVWDASRLLLLDSVDAGQAPGTLIRMHRDELQRLRGGATVHQLGVADLIATLSLACEEMPDIVMLGVQPASMDWGTRLTPQVEAALEPLIDMAIAQLAEWSTGVKRTGAANWR
jgi:hydrogenase maturation protease